MNGNLAFIACVERGRLEDQTILLCRSIRRFGGVYRDAPIYLFQPRPGMDVSERTLAVLCELGAVHISEPLNLDFSDEGTLNKIFVCAYAERVLDEFDARLPRQRHRPHRRARRPGPSAGNRHRHSSRTLDQAK